MSKAKRIATQFTMKPVPGVIFTITDYNSTVDQYMIIADEFKNHISGERFEEGIQDGTITVIPGKVHFSRFSNAKPVPKVEKVTNLFSFDDI